MSNLSNKIKNQFRLENVPGVKSIYQGKDESFPEDAQNGEQESN